MHDIPILMNLVYFTELEITAPSKLISSHQEPCFNCLKCYHRLSQIVATFNLIISCISSLLLQQRNIPNCLCYYLQKTSYLSFYLTTLQLYLTQPSFSIILLSILPDKVCTLQILNMSGTQSDYSVCKEIP